MTEPIYNPGQPYLLAIPGGFTPGKIIHLTGVFQPSGTSLVLKIQSGSLGDPNDEIGLCIYARLNERIFGMNAFTRATGWGQEETLPNYNFAPGQPFELTILGDPYHFKVAMNRQHFGEFSHRLNPAALTHFNVVSGSNDVTIHCAWVEDTTVGQMPASFPVQAPYPSSSGGYAPYTSSVGGEQQYHQNPGMAPNGKGSKGLLGMVGSAGAAVAGALGASHLLGKSKANHGGYPGNQPQYGGYPASQPQYGGYPASQPQYGGYPGSQPQYGGYPGGHKSGSGGILNKAMAVGGGLLGAKAMGKGLGGLGGGGKAMKYGLPLAGAAAGGYMLSKGIGSSFDFDGSFSDSD